MPVSRALLLARIFYFLYYAAWSFLLPFLALYYQSLGFAGSQIGVLAALSPLVTLFAGPLWGGVADATRRHKGVLLLGMTGAGLAVLALSQSRSFWLIAAVVVFYAFFSATIMPLVDSSVMALLGERRDRYGSQRLWGAVGWGLAGPAAGGLTGAYGLHWAFIGYLTLLSVALLVAWKLPIIAQPVASPFWKGVRQLLADRRWYVFLLIAFLSGTGLSVITNFLFLYMDGLQASRQMMGLALMMATISEVPVLYYSGRMLRRWGPRGLLLISLGTYTARAYAYTVVTEPWQVLIIQLSHGLTFSTMWVAGVSLSQELAPPGLTATAQGVFSSTVMGIGAVTGAVLGGLLLDRLGGAGMFFWSGTAILAGLLLYLWYGSRLAGRAPSAG